VSGAIGRLEPKLRARIAPSRGKPAVPVSEALEAVRAATGVDFSRSRARAGFSRGHLIDVVLSLPGGAGSDREHTASQSLLESLLGQARAADWLGEVLIEPAPRGGSLRVLGAQDPSERMFPVSELPTTFDRAIGGLYAGLPDRPLWSLGGELLWTMLEASAERADDYPAQDDLLLASTYLPEMLKCFLGGAPFSSSRFSRHGELFAYLKVESGSKDPRLSLSARRVLEDALDAALVSERAGRVVGSGLGIRYSYVDFALSNVDEAIAIVSAVARRVGLPRRSWILFCDTLLADEWAPVYAQTPAPPSVENGAS
jgi:hypothetical protein